MPKPLGLLLIATAAGLAFGPSVRCSAEEERISAAAVGNESIKADPPSGAIILFDGETNRFLCKEGEPCDWKIDDGELVSTPRETRSGHLVSDLHFLDAEIHVEFKLPPVGSGNSGIYIHGLYELQIFNSHEKTDLDDGMMGAVYGIAPPLENAASPPGEWQTYDITYIAPRRDNEGKITTPGSIKAVLNGRLVQRGVEIREPVSKYNPYRYKSTAYLQGVQENMMRTDNGPVFLQDHDSPVRFRNVWIRPLDEESFEYSPEK